MRVLVVDDEPYVRDTLTELLRRHGMDPMAVASGAEAMAALENAGFDFDAVIIDLTMPGMNGVELLGELRARSEQLPAIISSGYLEPGSGSQDADGEVWLAKPYRSDELLRALAGMIQTSATG